RQYRHGIRYGAFARRIPCRACEAPHQYRPSEIPRRADVRCEKEWLFAVRVSIFLEHENPRLLLQAGIFLMDSQLDSADSFVFRFVTAFLERLWQDERAG